MTPEAASSLRVLDPACGSGSFLLGAYQKLLDWHLDYYHTHHPDQWAKQKNPPIRQIPNPAEISHSQSPIPSPPPPSAPSADPIENRKLKIENPPPPSYRLTIAARKRILLNNIYGVDIDPQAVEVTKLSLLLKCLEGETSETLGPLLKQLQQRALPDLDDNIKCGNSLIAPDFYDPAQFPENQNLTDDEKRRINAMDWKQAFPKTMKSGGFNVVIGNPPYIRVHNIDENQRPYLYKHYHVDHRFDIYVAFIQRAYDLLRSTGTVGYIVPNKFLTADYGESLRGYLTSNGALQSLVDFRDTQVFASATTYTCLVFLTRQTNPSVVYLPAHATPQSMALQHSEMVHVDATTLGRNPWTFLDTHPAALVKRLRTIPDLGTFCDIQHGLQTGLDEVFIMTKLNAGDPVSLQSDADPKPIRIERSIIRNLVKGAVDLRRYQILHRNRVVFFPYRIADGAPALLSANEIRTKTPLAWEYLQRHEKQMKKTKGKNWYAFRRRNYDLLDGLPRILVPSIATRASFALDPNGEYHFVGSGGGGGGGYGLNLKPNVKVTLQYILGILNSRLMDWLVKLVNSKFGGGYYSFNRQYIEPLPIRPINFSDKADQSRHDRMVQLVTRMLDLHQKLAAAKLPTDHTRLQREIAATDQQIDALVYELYRLTPDEIKLVEESAG